MIKRKNKIYHSLIIALIFFVLSIFLKTVYILLYSDWNFTKINLDQYSFTLFVPILIFAWKLIIDIVSERQSEELNQLATSIKELPKSIQEITKQEVDKLKEDNEKFRKDLAKGVVEHDQHYYRTLTYKKEEGSIFNGFGDAKEVSRNVLFSSKTINLIFREINKIDNDKNLILFNIGKKASDRFAAEMVKDIQGKSKNKKFDLLQWIKEWIEFDSNAGFGKFEIESDEKIWKKNKVILLKYSFLTEDCLEHRNINFGLCNFMTGYLEGILNAFPHDVLRPYGLAPGNVRVEHNVEDVNECICAGRADFKGCKYHITSRR